MKYIKSLILFVTLSLFIYCTNQKTRTSMSDDLQNDFELTNKDNQTQLLDYKQNDLELMNLKGDVILLVEDGRVELTFFNDQGYIEKKVEDLEESVSYNIEKYTYQNNKLINIIHIGKKEKDVVEEREIIMEKDGGLFFSEVNDLTGGKQKKYIYVENNLRVKDSLVFLNDNSVGLIFKTKYYYSNNALVKKEFNKKFKFNSVTQDINSVPFDTSFQYYSNGLQKTGKSAERDSTFTEYIFDDKGNWVQRTEKNAFTRKVVYSETRFIYYKDDDIDYFEKRYEYLNNSLASVKKKYKNEVNVNINNNNAEIKENISNQKSPCFYCKGSGECASCSKTFTIHYWGGSGWKDRNESRRGYQMCTSCSGAGVKYKRSDYPNYGNWEVDKDCHVSACNNGWIFCNDCNSNGNGSKIGKCTRCNGSGASR